jgi:hypothetical protein
MIDHITFGQTHLIWPVVLGSVLLWLVFIWKEWTGEQGPRFYIKILAGLIAVSALAMIALQPIMRTSEKISYVAILSQGYEPEQRDSLKAAHSNIEFIGYKPGIDLSKIDQKDQEVFVLGQGLAVFDLWQLDANDVHVLGAQKPAGISRLKYDKENVVGNDFIIGGAYHKGQKGHQLVLMGPGSTAQDSVQLSAIKDQKFNLKTRLLLEGKFVYSLIEKDTLGHQLSEAPLAVTIAAKNKLNILMVNQFPSFETKYLKNFLAESGHLVRVRSQVSKGRYIYEAFNTRQKGAIDLSINTFNEIDLLIIDAASLQKASKSIREGLGKAITQEGLGLFIQGDANEFQSNIPLLDLAFLKQDDKEVFIEMYPKTSLTKYPYTIKKETLLEPVHQSNLGIITAYKRSGEGRIGTSLLYNTYNLLLEGETQVYQSLWSKIISTISKRRALESVWEHDEMMVYKDEPFHFKIKTTERPLVKSSEGYDLPLARNMDLEELWRGTVFPRKLGWNKLLMEHDSTKMMDFYVLDTAQWASLRAHKSISNNKRYFNQNKSNVEFTTSFSPVSPWWFFMVFLVTMSYLWLEPKI